MNTCLNEDDGYSNPLNLVIDYCYRSSKLKTSLVVAFDLDHFYFMNVRFSFIKK